MKIHVRQEHIDKGASKASKHCALALAINDQTTARDITLAVSVSFTDDNGVFRADCCKLNDWAIGWIRAFDHDKASVQPTVIDIPGLEDYVRPKVAEPVVEQRPSLPQVKEEEALV